MTKGLASCCGIKDVFLGLHERGKGGGRGDIFFHSFWRVEGLRDIFQNQVYQVSRLPNFPSSSPFCGREKKLKRLLKCTQVEKVLKGWLWEGFFRRVGVVLFREEKREVEWVEMERYH